MHTWTFKQRHGSGGEVKRAFHYQRRELKRSPEGARSVAFGARAGFWPCLRAPYVQVCFLFWRVEVWHGLPSYRVVV